MYIEYTIFFSKLHIYVVGKPVARRHSLPRRRWPVGRRHSSCTVEKRIILWTDGVRYFTVVDWPDCRCTRLRTLITRADTVITDPLPTTTFCAVCTLLTAVLYANIFTIDRIVEYYLKIRMRRFPGKQFSVVSTPIHRSGRCTDSPPRLRINVKDGEYTRRWTLRRNGM